MNEQEDLVIKLLADFRSEDRGLYGTALSPDDASKSLAYIATKKFKDVQKYRTWLVNGHPAFGGSSPVDTLITRRSDPAVNKTILAAVNKALFEEDPTHPERADQSDPNQLELAFKM